MATTATAFATPPTGRVLSIFDFDGTLFKSPSPSEGAHAKHTKVTAPTFAGGLGFFQSQRTLNPPYVPLLVKPLDTSAALKQQQAVVASSTSTAATSASTSETPASSVTASTTSASPSSLPFDSFDRWFITPTVEAYVAAKARGDVTAILTGREKYFKTRVAQLLEGSGFAFDHLYLKEHPRGGTVAYKTDVFINLIKEYKPSKVVYYEDRAEQGAKIIESLNAAFYKHFDEATADHYAEGGGFEMVMIDPSLSDTILAADAEAQLMAELIEDAKEEARKRKSHGDNSSRGYYAGGGGGGRGGGGRGRSDRNGNKPDS